MDNFARRSSEDRQAFLEQAAARRDVTATVVEQDLWVCWTLRRPMEAGEIAGHLTFKGGTPLSKSFGIIARFSENIDSVIGHSAPIIDKVASLMEAGTGGKERQRRTKALKSAARQFVSDVAMPALASCIKSALGTTDGGDLALDHEYLSQAWESFPDALRLQCIPEDESLWDVSRFEDFLQARRKLIAAAMNEHIASLSVPYAAPVEATVEELILGGESAELEFKQTFRWDVEKGQPNKKMEEAVAKAVAAFANSDGGTLLIGVHDTEGALGLEQDYPVTGGDRDGFELSLTTSLQNQFGAAFKANKVKVSFPVASGIEICRVDVTKSETLIPIEVIGKDGQKSKKIYVRSGNSSQELPSHEVQGYVNARAA